jgi:hypothetical protein
MKAYRESGGIAPLILNLGIRRKWIVNFTHQPPYPRRKCPRYQFHRRLGGPQNRSWRCGEYKRRSPLPLIEPHFLSCSARSLVTISTTAPSPLEWNRTRTKTRTPSRSTRFSNAVFAILPTALVLIFVYSTNKSVNSRLKSITAKLIILYNHWHEHAVRT